MKRGREDADADTTTAVRNAFVTPLPDPWFASPRNERDCLDSSPLAVEIALDPRTAAGLQHAVATAAVKAADGGVHAALATNVAGAVVQFDGRVVEEFCAVTGTMQPVPPLDLTFAKVEEWHEGGPCPSHLHLRIGRKLPLSSSVGNAPLVSF